MSTQSQPSEFFQGIYYNNSFFPTNNYITYSYGNANYLSKVGTASSTATSTTFSGVVNANNGLNVTNSVNCDVVNATVSLNVAGANINTIYAPLVSPTFTGNVALPSTSNVTYGGTALSSILNTYAPVNNATLTGYTTINSGSLNVQCNTFFFNPVTCYSTMSVSGATSVTNLTATGNCTFPATSNVTFGGTALNTLLSSYISNTSPTFTGTFTASSCTSVALPSTSVVTFGGTALNTTLGLLAPLASPTFTGTVTMVGATSVSMPDVANVSFYGTSLGLLLYNKAPTNNPTLTGTVNMTGTSSILVPSLTYSSRTGFICRYTTGVNNDFVLANGNSYNTLSTRAGNFVSGFCPKWITTNSIDYARTALYDGDNNSITSGIGGLGYMSINFNLAVSSLPPSSTQVCLFSIGGGDLIAPQTGGCIYFYANNTTAYIYTDTSLTQGYSFLVNRLQISSVPRICIILTPTTLDLYINDVVQNKTQLTTAGFLRTIQGNLVSFGYSSGLHTNGTTAWIGVQIYAFSMIATSTQVTSTTFSTYDVGPFDVSSSKTICSGKTNIYTPLTRSAPTIIPWACYDTSGSSQSGGADVIIGPTLRSSSGSLPWHYTGSTLYPNYSFVVDANCTLIMNHWQYITFIVNGVNMLVSIRVNGNNVTQTQYLNSSGTTVSHSLTCSQIYRLNVGDYVQFVIYGSGSYTIAGGLQSAITLGCFT